MGASNGGTSGGGPKRRGAAVFGFGGPAGATVDVCGPVAAGGGGAVCCEAVWANTGATALPPANAAAKFRRLIRAVVFFLLISLHLPFLNARRPAWLHRQFHA
jgi:hypothetical protein